MPNLLLLRGVGGTKNVVERVDLSPQTAGNCISANPNFIFLGEVRGPGLPAKLVREKPPESSVIHVLHPTFKHLAPSLRLVMKCGY